MKNLPEIHQMIIETARLLLEAGSETKFENRSISQTILDTLEYWYNSSLEISQLGQGNCALGFILPLFVKLFELLLMFEAKATTRTREGKMAILYCVNDLVRSHGTVEKVSMELYNILDNFANMFRCVILSDAYESFSDLWAGPIDKEEFTTKFTYLAGYSSQPGHSQNFIQILLNDMSANDAMDLKRMLTECQSAFDERTEEELRTFTVDALKWVEKIDVPRSLLHLARSAVISSMSYRSLLNLAPERLPHHLHQYVLMLTIDH